jgi:magnesium-transporting ATPase (P-type)
MHSYTSKDHLASAKREPQSLCEKRCDLAQYSVCAHKEIVSLLQPRTKSDLVPTRFRLSSGGLRLADHDWVLPMASTSWDLNTVHGLSEARAITRLQAEGPNELPTTKPRNLFATAWEILREPMILLLVGAGGIYLFLGELRDSIVLLVSIFVVIGISLFEERKTERA